MGSRSNKSSRQGGSLRIQALSISEEKKLLVSFLGIESYKPAFATLDC